MRQLAAWLAATDIDFLELQGPDGQVRIHREGAPAATAELPLPMRAAAAARPCARRAWAFCSTTSRAAARPWCHPAWTSTPGDLVALLQVGPLLLPVTRRRATARSAHGCVAPGSIVGYGTPLLELHRIDSKELRMDIDLNADLGEGFGPWRMGDDEALLKIISSANIACGFHAGDPVIMDRTVRLAATRGIDIDIGAHVGFPDLGGFGRRPMQIEPEEMACHVVYQLSALAGIAQARGRRMTHMSFHGALGNMAAATPSWPWCWCEPWPASMPS
jgi:hypothetical protein